MEMNRGELVMGRRGGVRKRTLSGMSACVPNKTNGFQEAARLLSSIHLLPTMGRRKIEIQPITVSIPSSNTCISAHFSHSTSETAQSPF